MKKYILVVLVLSFWAYAASANDSLKTKIGFYTGYNYNIHSANFYKLGDIPNCCKLFESGGGSGFDIGALFEYKLNRNFWLGARAGAMWLNGTLVAEDVTTVFLTKGPREGIFEHRMTGNFINLSLEPMIIFTPNDKFLISLGLRMGANMTGTYEQSEQITQPENVGTFADENGEDTGTRTRNESSGDIADVAELVPFQMSIMAMLSYELPLNKRQNLFLVPELAYYVPLTETVTGTEWKISPLRIGLSLKYAPIAAEEKKEMFEKELQIDTIQIESPAFAKRQVIKGEAVKTGTTRTEEIEGVKIITEIYERTDTLQIPKISNLELDITGFGVLENGKEIENPSFIIEEYVSNRLDPLLNYIFFDDNSAKLPTKFSLLTKKEASSFALDSLFLSPTLDIYYNMLNILGLRLQEYPDAKLTITGCNSNFGNEKSNLDLSQNRAKVIHDYLANVWNIDANRLVVQKRNLPQQASTPIDESDKIEENRRVELTSNNPNIFEPIFIEKVDRTSNPPKVKFKLHAESESGIAEWKVEAFQQNDKKARFIKEGKGALPESVVWNIQEDQLTIPDKEEPLIFRLSIIDSKGNSKQTDDKELMVAVTTIREKRVQQVGDYEVDKSSLILFDFDQSDMLASHKAILKQIADRIKPNSKVEILGYTDKTGEAEYNQKLSEKRANAVMKALGSIDAKAKGIGDTQELYDNSLPEGRFYCRTVVVIVTTPVK